MNEWFFIGLLGLSLLGFLFWLIKFRGQVFDTALLGLLTLGMALISVAILQPTSIKYGDMAMVLQETKVATTEAKEATFEAKEAAILANETVAMLMWNNGRLDGADTEAAKKILFKTYGKEDGQKVLSHFIEEGIFKASDEEKKKYQKTYPKLPSGLKSPLDEMINKNLYKQ